MSSSSELTAPRSRSLHEPHKASCTEGSGWNKVHRQPLVTSPSQPSSPRAGEVRAGTRLGVAGAAVQPVLSALCSRCQAVFLWCPGRPLAQPARHDPRQALHTHPCPAGLRKSCPPCRAALQPALSNTASQRGQLQKPLGGRFTPEEK